MEQLPSSIQHIAAYIRRSRQDVVRERKTDQDTLAEQRELLTKLLQSFPQPYEILEEIGSGDSIEDRPVFKDLLQQLAKVKPGTTALCVKEISRLGRGDMAQMGIIYNLLREKHIYIITPFKIYNPLNDEDDMAIQFYLFVARVELQMTKRRLRESRYTYASQGRWMTGGGGIPFGYRFNPFTQKLEPDEETAWIVQKIYQHYALDGIGYSGISTLLRSEGIRSPGGKSYFHPMTVRRILQNPAYKGELRFKTTQKVNKSVIKRPMQDWIVVPNAHTPIIDPQLWEQAQSMLAGTHRSSAPPVRLDFEPNPLAGLIRCGGCGKKMIRQCSTRNYQKKDGSVSTYHKAFVVCPGCRIYVKYASVEEALLKALQSVTGALDPAELEAHLTRLLEEANSVGLTDNGNLDKLLQEIEALQRERQQAVRLLTKEIITEEEYEKTRLEIELQQKEKEGHLASLSLEPTREQQKDQERDELLNLAAGCRSIVDVYSIEDLKKSGQNELLRGLLEYVVLHFRQKGLFDLDIALRFTV